IESQEETLLLGTDWFNKSRAKLDFDKSTLHVRYLGKQATINATHVSNGVIEQDFDEFTDEEEWIDELENDSEEIHEAFYTDECISEEDELYYNPWTDQNPAVYLTESLENRQEQEEILFEINKELPTDRQHQAKDLLQENKYIFAEKI
ncbi:5250_t:CDS:1, partial [Ambispora leptoticha]